MGMETGTADGEVVRAMEGMGMGLERKIRNVGIKRRDGCEMRFYVGY
jgi:hypothetical protein